ncbi:hypothetical protein DW918_01625 [Eubacterium ventriosum]|uniref:Uncharacterized protein n=1 Tax=Eubacterium ventriosum TaxID=39496 RepID=A0A413T9J2_9FIRM|nr:hypothetical protein DW918_01625 [Eubacterium ventriosum]
MFFDISAKSQVNTFSINENYAGLVLASDINKLSCSIDTNSMNDNIFSNNSGNISNSGSVRNYVDSFKTVIGDFNFSKIIFLKIPLYVAFPFHAFRKNGKIFLLFIMGAVFFSLITIIF